MRQPRWSQYEVALLVEAYWEMKNHKQPRSFVVSNLSKTLRDFGGSDVDSSFRNENGIQMRLAELDCIYSEGEQGIKNTSGLMRDIARMFVEEPIKFQELLCQAKDTIIGSNNYRPEFEKWLVSTSRKLPVERICKDLLVAEKYCLDLKVITKSIFSIIDLDIVNGFVRTITRDKRFWLQHKNRHKEIIEAANWYYSFAKYCFPQNQDISGNKHLNGVNDELFESEVAVYDYLYELSQLYSEYGFTHQDSSRGQLKNDVVVSGPDQGLLLWISRDLDNKTFMIAIHRALATREEKKEFSGKHPDLIFINRKWKHKYELCDFVKQKIECDKNSPTRRKDADNHRTAVEYMETSLSTDDLNALVESMIRDAKDGITKDQICKAIPQYSTHRINVAIASCHAVLVIKKYYHQDNISDFQEMADVLFDVINKQFSQNGGYTSAQQLYNEARPRLDDFFFYNNAFDSRQEVYDLAVHLFEQEKYKGNSYIFMNNMHIWKEEPDYPKDFHGLLIKFAREHGNVFTREAAIAYYEQIGSATPAQTFSFTIFKTGSKSFLQYDENQFVLAEALHINEHFIASVSSQIENLLEGEDYIATGEIDDYFYMTLPKLPSGIYWSALLLEDILRIYETNFTTIEAGKDNDKKTIPAAIVRKKTHYQTFGDVVWNEISKTFRLPKEFSASEFREFLLDKGFIRGLEKMWSVHKTVAGDIRFYWTDNNGRVTIN